jgi:hypothetical protein
MVRRQSSHTIRQSLVIPYSPFGIGKKPILFLLLILLQSEQGGKVSAFIWSFEMIWHFFDKIFLKLKK